MIRYLPILVLLVAGCTPQPQPAPQPKGPDRYAQGVWSWAIAIEAGSPQPKPAPQPNSGECDNCRGTGRLGDGTVSVPCPVCGGDGRIDDGAEPEQTPAEAAPQQPAVRQQTYQQGRRRGPIGRAIFGN